MSRTKPEGARNVVKGVVQEVGYLGNLSVYQVTLDSGKQMRVTKSNLIRATDGDAISWDDTVYLSWDGAAGVVLMS